MRLSTDTTAPGFSSGPRGHGLPAAKEQPEAEDEGLWGVLEGFVAVASGSAGLSNSRPAVPELSIHTSADSLSLNANKEHSAQRSTIIIQNNTYISALPWSLRALRRPALQKGRLPQQGLRNKAAAAAFCCPVWLTGTDIGGRQRGREL